MLLKVLNSRMFFRDVGVVIRERALLPRDRVDTEVGPEGRHHPQRQERSRQVSCEVFNHFLADFRAFVFLIILYVRDWIKIVKLPLIPIIGISTQWMIN